MNSNIILHPHSNNILNQNKLTMAYDLIKGKQVLIETIKGDLTHKDYKRVCEIAKRYTAYVTGEDIESLLIRFNPREDLEAFKQRVELTQLVTPYIANRLMTPMFKAGRTLAAKTLSWNNKEKSDEKKKKISDALSKYFGDMSLDDYLSVRLVQLDSTDPNSFIVTECPAEGISETEKPYPFEVNSEEAINYKYKNNKLQFLIVLNKINDLNRYTIYLKDDLIVAQQINVDDLNNFMIDNPNAEIIYKDEKKKDEVYVLTTATHKAGRIPAVRVGTNRDLTTRTRTCVPLIHPAETFFKKSIKTISEFDLTITLHTFPQKYSYDTVCPGDIQNNIICQTGRAPDGTACSICKGTGFNEHKTAQDTVRVPMPDTLKDIVPLEYLSAYKHPPSEILEFMKELGLYEIPELAIKAVYTSELFVKDTIATTATEKNIDLESVYDALKSFTDQWSNVYKHSVTVIAAYLSLANDIVIDHKFPKDFKMKSLEMLLDNLQKASSSGAPSYIKKEIYKDIAQKLYVDKPEELIKIEVKEKFFPFNGKTESEIMNITSNGLCSSFNKILYANFDLIFDELEQENTTDTVSFYNMELSAQRKLLIKKVTEYITVIDGELSNERAATFGAFNKETIDTKTE